MRSVQNFDVASRIEAGHRVITVAAAQPVEETWPLRTRAAVMLGGSAALWIAIGLLIHNLI